MAGRFFPLFQDLEEKLMSDEINNGPLIPKEQILELIADQRKKFFSLVFIKEDGTLRRAAAQEVNEQDARLQGLPVISYFDMNKLGVRRFRIDRLVSIAKKPIEEFNPADYE